MPTSKPEWLLAAPRTATSRRADTALYPFINRLVRGEDLSADEAARFFRELIDRDAVPQQIAGALVALTAKGETFAELAGMASVMRAETVKITSRQANFIDTTGTGSSHAKTFNVSTAAAFVAAGAGLTVAKQSNRHVASGTGSADVLEKLGVKVASEPEVAQTCLGGARICFMYAPNFHPAIKRVAQIRSNLGIRSCLNLLGVLSNPANAPKQIVGVWHESLLEPMARTLSLLKTKHAWVVHGKDGLDELTVTGETSVVEITGDKIRKFNITPEEFGLPRDTIEYLKADTPERSAQIIGEVFAGTRRDAARSLIVINAAAALLVGGLADSPKRAARLAEQCIDSGQAQNKLDRLIQTTNKR